MRPEAGWYPDSSSPDQLRWWDGSAWTSQTRSAEGAVRVHQPDEEIAPTLARTQAPVDLTKADESAAPPRVEPQPPLNPPVQSPYPVQSYPQYPATASGPMPGQRPLANQWLRVPARFIDFLLVSLVASLLAWPWADAYLAAFQRYMDSAMAGTPDMAAFINDPDTQSFSYVVTASFFVVNLLYEGVLLKTKGASLGKMAFGLRVTAEGGGGLSWLQALGRVTVRIAPTWVLTFFWTVLDSLWCLWDPRRQCLHDKFMRTVVVSTRR